MQPADVESGCGALLRGGLRVMAALALLAIGAMAGAATACAGDHVYLNEKPIADPAVLAAMRSYLAPPEPAGPGTGKAPLPPAERARVDCDKLASVLRAFGYLEAQVTCRPATAADGSLPDGTIIADPLPGAMFRVGVIDISGVRSSPEVDAMAAIIGDRIASYTGKPATSQALWAMESDVLRHVRDIYPLATVTQRALRLDHARRLTMVEMTIDSGSTATFGDLTFSGLGRVSRDTIRKELTFRTGQPYDGRLLSDFQRRIEAADLFQSVRVVAADHIEADGSIGIYVVVKEFRENVAELRQNSTPLTLSLLAALLVLSGRLIAQYAGGPRWLERALGAASLAALAVSTVLFVMRLMQLV